MTVFADSNKVVAFNEVTEMVPGLKGPQPTRYGFFSNMSAHSVVYEDLHYRTAEALFQCLRYPADAEAVDTKTGKNVKIREEIRAQKAPRSAKMKARRKDFVGKRNVEKLSPQDLENMRLCLKLKLDRHEEIQNEIRKIARLKGDDFLVVEDSSRRKDRFWGAGRLANGDWEGENMLGKLWGEVISEFLARK